MIEKQVQCIITPMPPDASPRHFDEKIGNNFNYSELAIKMPSRCKAALLAKAPAKLPQGELVSPWGNFKRNSL